MLSPISLAITIQVDADMLGEPLGALIREAVAAGRITGGEAPALAVGSRQRPATGDDRTVSQWLVVYREILARKTLKPATRINTASNLKHVERLWGGMPIRSLKPRTILAALQDGLGTASLRARVQALMKDVMKQAVLDEWIESNPVLALDSVRPKVQRKRMSLETLEAVSKQAAQHPQAWVIHMVSLGMATAQRRADLAKMRFDDVRDGFLHVEQQKEAGKGYGTRLAIPLSLRLDATGKTLGEVIDACRNYAPPGPNLIRQANGLPLEKSSLSARFTEIMRAAFEPDTYGPGEWPSLHELRSLSERLYRAQGVDTQALLGHTNQAMTDRYNDDRGLTAREFKRVKIAVEV